MVQPQTYVHYGIYSKRKKAKCRAFVTFLMNSVFCALIPWLELNHIVQCNHKGHWEI